MEYGRVNGMFLHFINGDFGSLVPDLVFLGNLALSRAIGDFEFKSNQSLEPEKQIVTSDPEITVHEPTEDDEFIVIACDGMRTAYLNPRMPPADTSFRYLGLSHFATGRGYHSPPHC